MVDQERYRLEHLGCAQRYGEAGVFAGSPPASRSGTGAGILRKVRSRDPNGGSFLCGVRVTSSKPRLTLSETGVSIRPRRREHHAVRPTGNYRSSSAAVFAPWARRYFSISLLPPWIAQPSGVA